MKYKYIFFDLDNTLLDFNKAEHQSFFATFPGAEEKDYQLYSKINSEEWKKYELGYQSRSDVFLNRFSRFLDATGFMEDPLIANDRYMSNLKFGYFLMDGALETLEYFYGKVHLVITTNGTSATQRNRIEKSGLSKYFDSIIISDEIGVQKPEKLYFETAIKQSGAKNKEEILIVGDSLSADIKGAQSVGLDTCWYNKDQINNSHIKPTYEIHNLTDLIKIGL